MTSQQEQYLQSLTKDELIKLVADLTDILTEHKQVIANLDAQLTDLRLAVFVQQNWNKLITMTKN